MANQIIIKGIRFVTTPIVNQKFTIRYRLTSDPDVDASYTLLGVDIDVATDGSISPNLIIDNLLLNTSYTIEATNQCNGKKQVKTILVEGAITYVWLEDTFVCEKDNLITQLFPAGGFSSPTKLFYNVAQNRIYVVDADDVNGNIYWFNPNTFSGTADVTHSSTIQKIIYDNAISFDAVRNRIYVAGKNTGGLIVYNMADNTLQTTVAYGTDGVNFNRLLVKQIQDNIYCSDEVNSKLVIINANTFIKTLDIGTISLSTPNSFNGAYDIIGVEAERWVISSTGRFEQDIYIYNSSFTGLVTGTNSIDLAAAVPIPGWGSNKYWGSGFYDEEKHRFYYHDIGSSKTFIINTLSKAIIKTIPYTNREGKLYAQIDISFDSNIGKLFFNYIAYDNINDPIGTVKRRSYIIDRDTLELSQLYSGLTTSSLVPQVGTPILWSANRNKAVWDLPNTNYNTDGVIVKLTY